MLLYAERKKHKTTDKYYQTAATGSGRSSNITRQQQQAQSGDRDPVAWTYMLLYASLPLGCRSSPSQTGQSTGRQLNITGQQQQV